MEAKVEITEDRQVQEMIDRIRTMTNGISKGDSKEQFHTVFASGPQQYHGVVLVPGKNDVHVRTKQSGELILTPQLNIPVYLREETKVKPNTDYYFEYMRNVLLATNVGTFDKRCVDVSYWVDGLSFTATVSLVDDPRKERESCQQLELEYDGHQEGTAAPTDEEILLTLERAAAIAFGGVPFSTRTKLEWLLAGSVHRAIAPNYRAIPAQESTLLKTFRRPSRHATTNAQATGE